MARCVDDMKAVPTRLERRSRVAPAPGHDAVRGRAAVSGPGRRWPPRSQAHVRTDRRRNRRSATRPYDYAVFRPSATAALNRRRDTAVSGGRVRARVCAIDPARVPAPFGCFPQSTLPRNFDEYRRACSHFCLWRINSPFAHKQALFIASSPLMVRWLGAHVASSAFLPRTRRLHCSRNPEAERFTRRFYPPPVWKVNAAVMFWKAAKGERCESGATCILGWAISWGLGQRVSLGEVVAQLRARRSTWPALRCWPSRRIAPTCC